MTTRAWILLSLALVLLAVYAPLTPAVALFLFARIRGHEVLEHPLRARLLALVQQRPGLGLSELATQAGVGWGTIVHHMNRLEDEGLVSSEQAGRRRAFFAAHADSATRGLAALAQRPAAKRLAAAVLARPGVSQRDAASAAGVSPPLAHRLLLELETRGLVRSEKTWRTRAYYATPRLHAQDQTSTMPAVPSGDSTTLSLQETNSI